MMHRKTHSLIVFLCAFFIVFSLLFGGCSVVSQLTQLLSAAAETAPDWENIPVELPASAAQMTLYYYEQLSVWEQRAYGSILAQIEQYPARIEIPMLNETQLNRVFTALSYDHPRLLLLGLRSTVEQVGNRAYFRCEYRCEKEDYEAMLIQLDRAAEAIIAEMDSAASEWEKERYLHDAIVFNCDYEAGSANESNPYGALVEKKATCEGYARAIKLLMDKAELECYVMSGMAVNRNANQENHMWNIVRIDGAYYHLDPTWDDPVGQDGEDGQHYLYFNLSDAEIAKTHSDYENANPCISTDANYYRKLGLYFTAYTAQVRAEIAQSFARQADAGAGVLELRFSSHEAYGKALDGLFQQQQIYRIIETVNLSAKRKINAENVRYMKHEEFYVISLLADWQC